MHINKKNDKHFNNRGYSLFFVMGIFLKHLGLIPNILKWKAWKILTSFSIGPGRVFTYKIKYKQKQPFADVLQKKNFWCS